MSLDKTPLKSRQVTKGLVSYLTKNRQLNLLPQIARETLKLSRSYVDPHKAVVQSAQALSAAQQTELKSTLETLFRHELALECTVNPALIGGLTIRVGDQVIDQSLQSKINQLSQSLSL